MSQARPLRHSSVLPPRGLEGCILFLKRIRDIHGHYLEQYCLEPSVFWHPALVLHTDDASNEATICILNTLNDCNAEDRFPLPDCRLYLAVWPKHPPFPGQPQLNLQGNATLRRPGYINIRNEYLVHQTMLQPYDWIEPTNYYRLTQKSFAVVVAKLDTIHCSRRLAKLNADDFARKAATSRAAKETLSDSNHSQCHATAKNANLSADIMRLMAVGNSLPSSRLGLDHQSEKAKPRHPLAATTTKVFPAKPESPTPLSSIRLFISVALLVAAMMWARSMADLLGVGQLAREFFKALTHVLMVALGIAWGVGKLTATGLGILGRTGGHLGWMVYCNCLGCVNANVNGSVVSLRGRSVDRSR